jgi:hypothetical protein
MGCDIHAVVEVKTKWGWEFVHRTYFDDSGNPDNYYFPKFRNYELFGFLAGVREKSPLFGPISKPRGFPEDCSQEVKAFTLENSTLLGDHSYSYVTLAEMMSPYANIAMRKVIGGQDTYGVYTWFHDNVLIHLTELVEFTENKRYNEVRVVFGFDS